MAADELERQERTIDSVVRRAMKPYLAAVEVAVLRDGPAGVTEAEVDKKWDEAVEVILAALFVVWRRRYAAAGGRESLRAAEWTKYKIRVRPYFASIRKRLYVKISSIYNSNSDPETQKRLASEALAPATLRSYAQVIAQTQTLSAYNSGTYTGFTQTGRQGTKTWTSKHDSRVRHSHQDADGQTVALNGKFTVGGFPADYPGDPALPAQEVVNCRCILVIHEGLIAATEGDVVPWNVVKGGGNCAASEWAVVKTTDGSTAGCHETRTQALAQQRALYASEGDMSLPNGWRGPIAALDVPTGDTRMLMTPEGGLRTREYPMSMTREHVGQGTDNWIGTIDYAWIQDGELWGEGSFDLMGKDGYEAARQLTQGLNTVSIQPDQVTFEQWFVNAENQRVEPDEALVEVTDGDMVRHELKDGYRVLDVMTDWRLASVAIVSIPAFDEARIEPVYDYVPRDQAALQQDPEEIALEALNRAIEMMHGPTPDHMAIMELIMAARDALAAEVADSGPTADVPQGDSLIATVTGNLDYPIFGDRKRKWDGHKARINVSKWASSDGSGDLEKIDWDKFSSAFLYRGKPQTGNSLVAAATYRVEDFKLGFVDIIEGKPYIVANAIIGLAGGHGIKATNIPGPEKKALLSRLKTLYGKAQKAFPDFPEYPFELTSPEGSLLAAPAVGGQIFDPQVFEDPHFEGPTALTVDENGHVKGHVALWDGCYQASPSLGSCTRPPKSANGYARFKVHGAKLTDGTVLPVGVLTFGEGHEAKGGLRASQAAYANIATAAAKVNVGEDEFGIWVSGEVLDAFRDRAYDLLLSPLSGHWEFDSEVGSLEMLAAHVVVTPGFKVSRLVASIGENGELEALQIAGPFETAEIEVEIDVEANEKARAALKRLGLDAETRAKLALERMGL